MFYCRIYDIKKVDVTLLKKRPPDLVIFADGRSATSGWKDPQLSQHVYIDPPKDGIQDFDFIAKRPKGIVLPVLTKISGNTKIVDIDIPDYWGTGMPLKGIRVHAFTNSVTYKFPQNVKQGKIRVL